MFQPTPAPPKNFAQHAHPMNHENIQSSNQIPTPAHTGHRTVYAVQELLEGSNLCSSAVSLSDRFRRGGAWGFRIGSASRLKSLLYTVVPFFLALVGGRSPYRTARRCRKTVTSHFRLRFDLNVGSDSICRVLAKLTAGVSRQVSDSNFFLNA